MFCQPEICAYVRPSRNVRLGTANKRLDLEALIGANMHLHVDTLRSCAIFSSESPTLPTLILKVKDLNALHLEGYP